MDFMEILKQHGPWVAICVYFVWQSWVRETKLGVRLNQLEEFLHTTMAGVITDNTRAMILFREILKERPCLIQDADKIVADK